MVPLYARIGGLTLVHLILFHQQTRAETVLFDIVPAESVLTIGVKVTLANFVIGPQVGKPDSLVAHFGGQIRADFDGSAFSFDGSSAIDAVLHPQHPFQPAGAGEDNFGGERTAFPAAKMAARDLVLTIASGSAAEGGSASGLVFQFSGGRLDMQAASFGSGSTNLATPDTVTNSSHAPLSSVVSNGVQSITIPIDFTYVFDVALPNDSSVNMRGQIVATRSLAAPLLWGDYNHDDVVDAADYTVWRDSLGRPDALPNDDTVGVDLDDYDRWKANFVQSADGESASSKASALPEPPSFSLLVLICAKWRLRRSVAARALHNSVNE